MNNQRLSKAIARGLSFLVLTACYTLVGIVFLAQSNMSELLQRWGGDVQLSVYFKDGVTEAQKQEFKSKVSSLDEVQSHKLITQSEALAELKDRLGDYVPTSLLNGGDTALLPESALINLKAKITGNNLEATLEKLKTWFLSIPYIDEVIYGQDWIKNYARFYSGFRLMALIAIFIIISTSLFVIGYTIFGSISQRRIDIEIYELVGATQMYIIRPFLVEGLWLGVITGGVAVGLTYLFHLLKEEVISNYLGFLMVGDGLSFFSATEVLLFVVMTGACSLASSYLSVRKISSGWAAAGTRS